MPLAPLNSVFSGRPEAVRWLQDCGLVVAIAAGCNLFRMTRR
jgi:hypothetical protein